MTDEILAKFDQYDKKKKGKIDYSAFKALFTEVAGSDDEKTCKLYFNGIDVNRNGDVSKEEFTEFVNNVKDPSYTIKMAFRAFDEDKSGNLNSKEVLEIAKYAGADLTEEQVQEKIQSITGDKKGKLTYAQVVKMITGKDIDPKTDPYDGKLKSSCCNLI